MKELLRFVEHKNAGKTRKFDVFSNHSGDYLGIVHWRSGWRCYVMSYADGVDMSLSCNKELDSLMEKLEEERKSNLIKLKKSDDEIKLCKNCFCMTKTKRGYIYICGKCGKDRRRENGE